MVRYLDVDKDDLVAVVVSGTLEKDDYEQLIPLMEVKISHYGKINLYWEMEEFEGWNVAAAWQDLKLDVSHANDFRRVAMVGAKKWEDWLTQLMKPFSSAEIKYFDPDERELAMAWVKDEHQA
ncbi:STAS/SEC14 domain-containing protein [Telluribacter sp.]|jgi:hypothetical protein|uniref:STAS/SEC14 domain-containing protein n=1 Tax=Telluribacter sp. TaxID=1978767 RepID=UPI002E157E44|nr:STAS/SEC14 domain-containing protein [Telluribacter sp.]